jgi:hypothetical protein
MFTQLPFKLGALMPDRWQTYLAARQIMNGTNESLSQDELLSPTVPGLEGVCHEIFRFLFLPLISFPHGSEYPRRSILNFYENSLIFLNLKVNHRCRRHQR